jgi:hypothetical protein
MQVIGLTEAEQTSIFRVLATVLWLGNVTFKEKDDGNADIADTDVTDFVAYLMETKPEHVTKVLRSRVMETQRGGRRGTGVFSLSTASSFPYITLRTLQDQYTTSRSTHLKHPRLVMLLPRLCE